MKFRHTVWIKRGQFVFVQPIEEGDKVKAEITHILDAENIEYIRENRKWPDRFEVEAEKIVKNSRSTSKPEHFIDPEMLPPSESESDEETTDDDESEGIEDKYAWFVFFSGFDRNQSPKNT